MDTIVSTIIPDHHGKKEFHTPDVDLCHRLLFEEDGQPYRDVCQAYIVDSHGHRFICVSDTPITI